MPDHMLARLCAEDDGEVARDALLLLLRLYASVDYAVWMGASPNAFFHQRWDMQGTRAVGSRQVEFRLGRYMTLEQDVWGVAPPLNGSWLMPRGLPGRTFGGDAPKAEARVTPALDCLLALDLVCRVAVVSYGSESYPLWIFSPAYRDALAEAFGLRGDIADGIYRLASENGADPNLDLMAAVAGSSGTGPGTGLWFCLSPSTPQVYTLLAPRLHAPTPRNVDGLIEQARMTRQKATWIRKLRREPAVAA
ncbi:MAG: hypothetical protein ACREVL_01720, partial [Solimonas sp.]